MTIIKILVLFELNCSNQCCNIALLRKAKNMEVRGSTTYMLADMLKDFEKQLNHPELAEHAINIVRDALTGEGPKNAEALLAIATTRGISTSTKLLEDYYLVQSNLNF